MPPLYTNSESDRMLIAYQSSKLLTLAFSNYTYTDGAHGNYRTEYTSVDLINRIKLKLQDIVNTQGGQVIGSYWKNIFG